MKADDEFIKYCLDNYHIPHFTDEDFLSDLNKIVILKKMLKRFVSTGAINERLALNNIIILLNVFGIKAGNKILFYRAGEEYYSHIKSFLLYLDCYIPCDVTENIEPNERIAKILKDRVL